MLKVFNFMFYLLHQVLAESLIRLKDQIIRSKEFRDLRRIFLTGMLEVFIFEQKLVYFMFYSLLSGLLAKVVIRQEMSTSSFLNLEFEIFIESGTGKGFLFVAGVSEVFRIGI